MPAENKVISVLKEARRLIDEVGWTQGTTWRDKDGEECFRERAACYCLDGAIYAASFGHIPESYGAAQEAIRVAVGRAYIRWNDKPGRTKAEVLDALSRAIAAAQTEGR